VNPTATTTYTLTATDAAGATTATAKVTVTASGGKLAIATASCPAGTQGAAYAGCTIAASGGTPPYKYSLSADVADYPPLPEGMTLDATTGKISSSLIGGQGSYTPEFVVTDSSSSQATKDINFPRGAHVLCLFTRGDQGVLREQLECSLSKWNTGH
jgi:hypothetical protein